MLNIQKKATATQPNDTKHFIRIHPIREIDLSAMLPGIPGKGNPEVPGSFAPQTPLIPA
jgi:hypothetical protein